MKLYDAVEIVLKLAKGGRARTIATPESHAEAREAIGTVEDFFVNHADTIEENLLEIEIPKEVFGE